MSTSVISKPTEVAVNTLPSYPQVSPEEIESKVQLDSTSAFPVALLFGFALAWLIGWSLLNLVLYLKLLFPNFLGSESFLTYGRLQPVAKNMFAYGWASCAAMGVSIWLMVRLCRVKLGSPLAVVIGILFWNTGLLGGLIGIQCGAGRSLEYMELPLWAELTMLTGFLIIAMWVISLFFSRQRGTGFISQAYIVAGFIWFAWTLLAGNIFASMPWVNGVAIAINNAWFVGAFIHYWFTSIGLGAAFYLIPKVTGRPIHSYYLANLGFWSFAFLAGWGGLSRYNGGPIPVWVMTLNIVATALMIIPVATIAVNHHFTIAGSHKMMHYSPTLRFTVVGAMAFTVSTLTAILLSLRNVAQQTGLGYTMVAQTHLVLYAFFSFVMFGAIYFIVPRLVGREWISSTFIKLHFWGSSYGIGLTILVLTVAGLFQGKEWANLNVTNGVVNQVVISATLPLLRGAIIGGIFLLLGHLLFFVHFLLMMLRLGQVSHEPTLLAMMQTEEAH